MSLFLFGFKKCGKTYLGIKLAQALRLEFFESDHMIEELYTAQYHQTLSYREIVKKHGFEFFQELEKRVVSLLAQKRQCIVSLGGGLVLDPENVTRLEQVGTLVYLKAPKMLLKTRILSGDIPHYLDPQHPGESFDKLFKERAPLYEAVPAQHLDIADKSEEEVLKVLLDLARKSKKHRHT